MAQRLRNVHRQTESDVANILFVLSHSMDFAAKTKTPRTPYQMSTLTIATMKRGICVSTVDVIIVSEWNKIQN